jgi:hypothetical protein
MTLTMAWTRMVGTHEELVFASDSRLSGGSDWNCCPKLMLLPRGDSLIAFAGSTLDAYPLMLQFRNWVETDPGARTRFRDINSIKKRMRTIFNDMRIFIDDLPRGQSKPDPPDCELIFGGWSWQAGDFRAWRFRYVQSREMMDFEPFASGMKIGRDHPIVFAGNPAAVETARDEIIALLMKRGRFRPGIGYFDMEHFEVLRDIIRGEMFDDVGGPPQLFKVYKHGNSQPFAVRWPMPDGRTVSVLGRPLFPRERTHLPVLNPDAINFLPAQTLAKRRRGHSGDTLSPTSE